MHFVLYYTPISTLQIGLQPIHIAVQNNHENVVQMLVDDLNVKLDSTTDVIITI